jgi:hypothetical protein
VSVRLPGLAINRAADFRDQFGQRPRSIETQNAAGQSRKPCLMRCQIAALTITVIVM